jgi:hypothetical protein
MGLEAATYIDQLVVSNPTGLDEVNKGDDHLRLIKSVLINSLGNIGGAVLTNETELNLLVGLLADSSELNILDGAIVTTAEVNFSSGVTSSIQAQIDAITAAIDALFPVGHQLNSSNAANPSTYGYPGVWAQTAQGRVIIGEGSGIGLTTRVAGVEAGVEDAVVVDHGHASAGVHNHKVPTGNTSGNDDNIVDEGDNPNATNVFTANAGAHTHPNAGVSGVDMNMQPYQVVYIFERTS